MTNVFKPDTSVGYRHEMIPPNEPDCPYLERWIVGVGIPGHNSWFSVRLHHFFRSDEDHLHDHPTGFLTLCLAGSYEDWVECPTCNGKGSFPFHAQNPLDRGDEYNRRCDTCRWKGQVLGTRMTPGTLRYRHALHRHRVVTDGCWTLVLFGPRKRDWGFVVDGKWMRQRAYFRKFGGHSACE
jgi:hypothetical protein